jgi:chromosome segregation protein
VADRAEQAARDASSAAEVARAGARERLRAAIAVGEACEARIASAAARREAALAQAAELRAGLDAAERERAEALASLAGVDSTRSEAWDRLQRERERVVELREHLRAAEEGVRAALATREASAAALATAVHEVERVQGEIEAIRRRIDERYQLSLSGLLDRAHAGGFELGVDAAVQAGLQAGGRQVAGVEPRMIHSPALHDTDEVEASVARLEENRAALAAIGEVNLGALPEYEELVARHAELVGQRADLEESVGSLRAAIARMNRECRQRFRDAFDRVNENFQGAYPRLVGGGSARLVLTDDEDLLQTGVEIFVQPPGKRLQNLNLLSGGAKAMTALALMIALFQVKPSPFCVLDEVDAPLDEANGTRFNDMLREMSTSSQFVVITHNRKTMESADALYGITMARPGVSRLVSVEL